MNVLASAGSASELFLRQARADVPLTVTDTGMLRYWITMGHAATLAAHGALLAADGVPLATASDPVVLTVGELAQRIWRQAGQDGEPDMDVIGIRPGETQSEVLIGPGEELGEERHQGIARDRGRDPDGGAGLGRWSGCPAAARARTRARSGWRRCADRLCSARERLRPLGRRPRHCCRRGRAGYAA